MVRNVLESFQKIRSNKREKKKKKRHTITYERTKSNTLDGSFMIELPERSELGARVTNIKTLHFKSINIKVTECLIAEEKHTPNGIKFDKKVKKSRKSNG